MKKSILTALTISLGLLAAKSGYAEVPDSTVIVKIDQRYEVTARDVKNFLSETMSSGTWTDVSIENVGSLEGKAKGTAASAINKFGSFFSSRTEATVTATITVKAHARWDLNSDHSPRYTEKLAPEAPELLTCDLNVDYTVAGANATRSDMVSFDCNLHKNEKSVFTLKGTVNQHPLHKYVKAATFFEPKSNMH
jgi:hypothetical protein